MKSRFETANIKPEGFTPEEKAEMLAIDLKFRMRSRMSREFHRVII